MNLLRLSCIYETHKIIFCRIIASPTKFYDARQLSSCLRSLSDAFRFMSFRNFTTNFYWKLFFVLYARKQWRAAAQCRKTDAHRDHSHQRNKMFDKFLSRFQRARVWEHKQEAFIYLMKVTVRKLIKHFFSLQHFNLWCFKYEHATRQP